MKQRRALNSVAIVFAVHGTISGNFATRVPWIADRLSLDAGALGMALLCSALGAAAIIPLAGKLVSRFGSRTITRSSIAVYCAFLAVPAFAPNLTTLCAALLIYGVFAGISDVGMKAQGSSLESRLQRPIMSRLFGMWSLGALVGAGVGTLATFAPLDARLHLGWIAVALLVLAAITGVALPRNDAPAVARVKRATQGRRFPMPSKALLAIAVVGFCAAFGEAAAHTWSAVYITDVTGGGPATASIGFAAFVASMAAGRFAGDTLVQRLGPVRTVQAAGLLAAAGGTGVVIATAPLVALLGFAAFGLGIAVILPVALSAGTKVASSPAQGLTAILAVGQLACMVSPATIGGIADSISLPVAFAATVAVIVPVVLMAGSLREPAAVAGRLPVAAIEAVPATAGLSTIDAAIGMVPMTEALADAPLPAFINELTVEIPVATRDEEYPVAEPMDTPHLMPVPVPA